MFIPSYLAEPKELQVGRDRLCWMIFKVEYALLKKVSSNFINILRNQLNY